MDNCIFINYNCPLYLEHFTVNGYLSTINSLKVILFFSRVLIVNLTFFIFLSSDQSRLRKLFIITGDLDLLSVFENFFQVIVIRSKFLKFLFQVLLHFNTNLVSPFSDDHYSLLYISRVGSQLHHVTGYRIRRGARLSVIHFTLLIK